MAAGGQRRGARAAFLTASCLALLIGLIVAPRAHAYEYSAWFCGTASHGTLVRSGYRCPAWHGAKTGHRHHWNYGEVYQADFLGGVRVTDCVEDWRWLNGHLTTRRCVAANNQGQGYVDTAHDVSGTLWTVMDAWAYGSRGYGGHDRVLHGWAHTR